MSFTENQGLWIEFLNKENTEKILNKKANTLAPILIQKAALSFKVLEEGIQEMELEEKITGRLSNLWLEFIIFYTHLVDKTSSQYLSEQARDVVLDSLNKDIIKLLSEGLREEYSLSDFKDHFIDKYNARQFEYAEYSKLLPQEEESPKDTLFWEFGKRTSKIIQGTEKDVRIILLVQTVAVDVFVDMQLDQLITGKSNN